MTFVGGPRRGGWTPVPQTQAAENRRLEQAASNSSIITSVSWHTPQARIGENVGFRVQLRRPLTRGNTVIEIFFHGVDGIYRLNDPIQLPIMGQTASGSWAANVSSGIDWSKGHFTVRATVDRDMKTSGALRLIDDPVVRAVRRNFTDGFDGPIDRRN